MSEYLESYKNLLLRLYSIRATNDLDEALEDQVLDHMDVAWWAMTPNEREHAEKFAREIKSEFNLSHISVKTKDLFDLSALNKQLVESVLAAKIVILPEKSWRNIQGPLFPNKTGELLNYLKNIFAEDVEISVNENDYKELALHSYHLYLPKIFIKKQFSLKAVEKIFNYIEYELGDKINSAQLTSDIIVELAVDDNFEIKFEGVAAHYKEYTLSLLQAILE